MKIDLRFTLDSENEEHKQAIKVYNSLRRKHRVEFFVELTKPFWGRDLVDYPLEIETREDQKTVLDLKHSNSQERDLVEGASKEDARVITESKNSISDSATVLDSPKKRSLLLG